MAYDLVITERAEELIDDCVFYIKNKLKSLQAAGHLLDEIAWIYDRLEDNPYQFEDCKDDYLKSRGYKEALITKMQYRLIFRIDDNNVYVVGLFHNLENYTAKVLE